LLQGKLLTDLEKDISLADDKVKLLEVSMESFTSEAANMKRVAESMVDEKESALDCSAVLEALVHALNRAHQAASTAVVQYSRLLNARSNVHSTKSALAKHEGAVKSAQEAIQIHAKMARALQNAASAPECISAQASEIQEVHEKRHLAAAELILAKGAADGAVTAAADAQEAAKHADMELEYAQAHVAFQHALLNTKRKAASLLIDARKGAEAIMALQLQHRYQAIRKAQAEEAAAEV
jgi:hypothetical protein